MPVEGPNPGHARRGRRNPALLSNPEPEFQDVELLEEEGNPAPDSEVLLLPGDVIAAKATVNVDIYGKDAWFSYGVQSRVQEHENEAEAFNRVGSVVNTRVLDLAEDAYDRITAAQQEHDAQLEQQRQNQPAKRLAPRR